MVIGEPETTWANLVVNISASVHVPIPSMLAMSAARDPAIMWALTVGILFVMITVFGTMYSMIKKLIYRTRQAFVDFMDPAAEFMDPVADFMDPVDPEPPYQDE